MGSLIYLQSVRCLFYVVLWAMNHMENKLSCNNHIETMSWHMLASHDASYKLVEILNGHSTLSVLSVYGFILCNNNKYYNHTSIAIVTYNTTIHFY